MKAPFFLLGFFLMLITVSAFARMEEEQVPYEQSVKNIPAGMTITFPKDFRLDHNGSAAAYAFLYNLDRTDFCQARMEASQTVRLSTALAWKVERSFTNNAGLHQLDLTAFVDGEKRTMYLMCKYPSSSIDLLRSHKIEVPRTKAIKVEVIRDQRDESQKYDHERDVNATIAI